jgi:hypothetical protein
MPMVLVRVIVGILLIINVALVVSANFLVIHHQQHVLRLMVDISGQVVAKVTAIMDIIVLLEVHVSLPF